MAQLTWPDGRDWLPSAFLMQPVPNERSFTGYYSGQSQVVDLPGEAWAARLVLPARRSLQVGAQREAFLARLRPSNTLLLWHLRRPAPRGTLRGSPTISGAVAQLASTINIQSVAGATLEDGDMLGFAGQVSMVVGGPYVANGSGLFTAVQIWPRARTAISSGAAVTWDKPTVEFRTTDRVNAPVEWLPGGVSDSITITLAEA